MKYQFCTLFIVASVMLLILPQLSMADFFKYKDNKGNLIITNRFEDVPKKYRNRVIVVWDKDLAAKDPVARRSAVALGAQKGTGYIFEPDLKNSLSPLTVSNN